MKLKKRALFHSLIALLLCFSMLVGTTFAWFTDGVSSGTNTIAAGTLDIELEYLAADGSWTSVNASTEVLDKNALWEPGYVEVAYLRVTNAGNLALKYALGIGVLEEIGSFNAAGQGFYLSDYIQFGIVESETPITYATREDAVAALTESKPISEGLSTDRSMPKGDVRYVALVVYMPETVGNAANYATGQTPPSIELGIELIATQAEGESDSFGTDYDSAATISGFSFPTIVHGDSATGDVTADENNQVVGGITLQAGSSKADIPEGVQLEDETTALTLKVTSMEGSGANITLGENEEQRSLDVHVTGVAAGNTVPMEITIQKAAPIGLNSGNLKLYHVENGTPVAMDLVETFTAHNQFKYDPATGTVTLYMANFSEVTVVADTVNGWKGNVDHSWYVGKSSPYTIANADQLWSFSQIVGGMNGQTQDSFTGETVKLISDINLNDTEGDGKIFYPIGYTNSTGKYERTNASITSTVNSFEGTFDGQGHTIANFYQNTWEMFGDYNDGYSAGSNYYKDAMGLFGYVVNGTVQNLTVKNFSSDGEFTPTGVIAAYAVNSNFENIAIVGCNPRVYNTGNGGIIGIAGRENEAVEAITLKNITVDNSNTISALWGSYDVACGGLVGMYRGNVDGSGNATGDTISFENCHVSAIMDVYNDVCGNYQYYAYRYSGMIIGSVRHNATTEDGKTIPNMTGISATGCTVNYGTWNDYYYCEFVSNGHPSYSGQDDYKFSRVPNSEIDTTNGKENATCIGHNHSGVEDNQAIYLPFDQLFTGYGWGVNSVGLKKYGGIYIEGVSLGDQEESVEKFTVNKDYKIGTSDENGNLVITIGDLFKATATNINVSAIQVSVTDVTNLTNPVTGEFVLNPDDWTKSTLTLKGYKETGTIAITIQDYNFCKPTTATFVNGGLHVGVLEFVVKLPDYDYIYRVGNMNTVALGSLFQAKDGATINSADVYVEIAAIDAIENSSVTGEFTPDASDWTKGTIKFDGTGFVKVTIRDKGNSKSVELTLEVVDAMNATAATSATKNNVVLLNNVGLSTIEVSGGYTLYGNGFKMTATTDPMYDTLRAGFVTLDNGTLDNVQIICPNFSYAIIYNSQIKDTANTAKPSDSSNNDARGNVRSAVMATGNSKILDSYVHGGRAAVFLRSGNLVIDGSTISGGAAANIHALSAQSLTLRDVTLIQKPFQATVHDTSKTLMGFSGLFECGEDGISTPLILEGTLTQNAWINENYAQYVPSKASSIVEIALGKTAYLHDLDGDGKNESLNLGFTYMPQDLGGNTSAENITDNRTNKAAAPYESVDVGNAFGSAKVYSYINTNGTAESFKPAEQEEPPYTPTTQGSVAPTLSFTDTNENRVFETKFDTSDNRWESTLTVNLDNGNYAFSFTKLLAMRNGTQLTYSVKTVDGTEVDISKDISLTAPGVTTYEITVTPTTRSAEQLTCYFNLVATKTTILKPVAADTTGGTPLLVVKSKNSDWTCALPALEGIKIKYYTADGEVILDLATLTPTSTGKQNGTQNYWEITQNGYTLKVTCGVIHDTKSVYGMPVVVDNNGTKQMYFTISSTTGYVSTGTAARSVTLTYEFTDPNGQTLTFTKNYNVKYADYKDVAQYSYSDFVKGTMTDLLTSGGGNSSSCITPDTLITLADGKQVRVDSLTGSEQLLVWNLETGKYDTAPIVFVDSEEEAEYEIIHLYFSDGSDVKVIYEHGFFDLDLGKYVYIDAENYADYIGHRFVTQGDIAANRWNVVTLDQVTLETEVTTAWSPVTHEHLCYYTNGVLSMPGGIEGLFNIFEVDTETLRYDAEMKQRDIETYGLLTLDDFGGMITEEAFQAFNGAYLNIAIGKGLLTWEEIAYMAQRYIPLM